MLLRTGEKDKQPLCSTLTFAEEGSYPTSVTLNEGNGHSATNTGSATVADAALHVTKFAAVNSGKGVALGGIFIDADSQGAVSDYKVTISWSDGTTASAVIVKNPVGNGFVVAGVHRYAQHGTFTVTLTVTDGGGSSITASQTITV